MNSFQLFLTIDEINLILTALGDKPFAQVADLIANIRTQGQAQMQQAQEQAAKEAEAPVVATLDKAVRGRKPKAQEVQPPA